MRIRQKVSLSPMGSVGSLASRGEVLPPPLIETRQGSVQGRKFKLKDGSLCDVFQGIPYAQPPIGNLRFAKPQPVNKWDGVLKCGRYQNRSVQSDMFWDKLVQSASSSEDCLYLNIFAPSTSVEPGKKYPVMFYIHGGGFMMDSPNRLVPKKLCKQIVSRGIVLVTVAYRLGYLGFFCTGDEACKGNMGLYDQALALKWTKENIEYFGGDPEDITVAGQSAGSVSADLLSLSPLTRDLFRKKIIMGGNSFCHWALTTTEEISDYCKKKAYKLGWKPRKVYDSSLEENEDMIHFLRSVPAHKFATTMHGNKVVFTEARLPLAPVYDDEILPKPLDELRAEAPKMESIVGVGSQESLLFIAIGFLKANEKDLEQALRMIAKKSTNFGYKEVCDIVNQLYGDMSKIKDNRAEVAKLYVTMVSDIVSNYACYQYLKHSQTHDKATYAFSFDYTSKLMYGWLGPMVPFRDGTHASEIIYLLDVNYFSSPFSKDKEDREMCEMTADYFTSFIKNGNPNSPIRPRTWEPLPKDGTFNIFSFDLSPKMEQTVFDGRMSKLEFLAAKMKEERLRNLADDFPVTSSTAETSEIPVEIDQIHEIDYSNRPRTVETPMNRRDSLHEKKRAQSAQRYRSNSVAPIQNERLIS